MSVTSESSSLEEVGVRIKMLRTQQRLTLAAVSEGSGLTRSFLSKLERGHTAVSITSLIKISDALGVRLETLLDDDPGVSVDRAADRERQARPSASPYVHELSPESEWRIHAAHTSIPPGECIELDTLGPDQVEFYHVLSGALEIQTRQESVSLNQGDSATLNATSGPRTLWAASPSGRPGDGTGERSVFLHITSPQSRQATRIL